MNVREMIELLSTFDPTAEVVVEYNGQYQKVKAVQAQVMLTDGASWGDYQGVEALKVNPLYPASEEEEELNVASPKEVVVAIGEASLLVVWGWIRGSKGSGGDIAANGPGRGSWHSGVSIGGMLRV